MQKLIFDFLLCVLHETHGKPAFLRAQLDKFAIIERYAEFVGNRFAYNSAAATVLAADSDDFVHNFSSR